METNPTHLTPANADPSAGVSPNREALPVREGDASPHMEGEALSVKEGDALPVREGEALPVMESFYTLQGEGYHQGKAAYFIRLGGCDVGCAWCDVKDSWDAGKHPLIKISSLVESAGAWPGRLVVITGGEPLMHDCTTLTRHLHQAGFATHIETSGAWPLSGDWDWICLSPKKFKAPLPEILPFANELKVVIYNRSDFDWAEQWAAKTAPGCQLFLQPEWSKSATVTPLIIDYIKANPQWRFSLQLHKYIHVP